MLPDNLLLLLVGYDAYVFLKTLKLVTVIMLVLMVGCGALLLPIYFNGPLGKDEYFYVRLSIRNISKPAMLWFPYLALLLSTGFVFYMLYAFYRNYVVTRQAYLKSPNTFQALNKIEAYTGKLRSYRKCEKLFDIPSRTVVVTGISSTYSKERIQALFEDMRLGDIQSLHIVRDRSMIQERLDRLNRIHQQLEMFYLVLYERVKKHLEAADPELEAKIAAVGHLSAVEKTAVLRVVNQPDFYKELRESYKNKDRIVVDGIGYTFGKMMASEAELNDLVREYVSSNHADALLSPLPYANDSQTQLKEQAGESARLISLGGLVHLGRPLDDFKLTTWGTSTAAVIVFEDARSAAVACQALLSVRPFSLAALPAPMATEVDWDNVYMPRADRAIRAVLGDALYIMTNVFFMVFAALITSVTNLAFLERHLPFIHPVLSKSPALSAALQGVLAPLGFNIVMLLAPYLLMILTYYQAHVDKAKVQLALMNRYSWLLFLQTFVAQFAGTAVEVVEAVMERKYTDLLKYLENQVALTSAFYFNVILQKALIGLMIVLVKPGSILSAAVQRVTQRRFTPRQWLALNKPGGLPLGFLYPEYAVIVFQMTLAFAITTPVILLIGFVFFALAYYVFRTQFLYSNKVPHEAGGLHWPSLCMHILFAQLLAQIFTLIQFISLKGSLQAFLTLPLMAFTVMGMISINRRFHQRITYQALSNEAQAASLMLVKEMTVLREQFIKPDGDQVDLTGDEDRTEFDSLPVQLQMEDPLEGTQRTRSDSLGSTEDFEEMDNPYTNPTLFQRLKTLLLPHNFFALMRVAMDADKKGSNNAAGVVMHSAQL